MPRVHHLLERLARNGAALPVRACTWRIEWTREEANVAGERQDIPGDEIVSAHVVARAVRLGYATVTQWRARGVLSLTACRVEITPAGRERLSRPGYADLDRADDAGGDLVASVDPTPPLWPDLLDAIGGPL